jgi:hypothetical protein
MFPTALSRARGSISDCDSTLVWERKRSTIKRMAFGKAALD